MRYRLFSTRCWLTPAMQEKVRKERSESPESTPEIRYKREKIVEDREFASVRDILEWVPQQAVMLNDFPDVRSRYVVLWGFIANPSDPHSDKMEARFRAEEVELPLT